MWQISSSLMRQGLIPGDERVRKSVWLVSRRSQSVFVDPLSATRMFMVGGVEGCVL